MQIVTDTNSLEALCDRLSNSSYVTVDTEFVREKTYWPQLCLVQLANDEEAAIVDVLSSSLDKSPLLDLMSNPKIIKVFHSARQDFEIFFKLMKKLPTPIFDTQIAAMVCGFGDSVGYETLVQNLINKPVDKSHRYTDWTLRPLSKEQMKYAISDVTYLREVYKELSHLLKINNRQNWLEEEIEKLNDEENYNFLPDNAWKRIKLRTSNPRSLGILMELASWREKAAQARNLPRNKILRDEALIELSNQKPTTARAIARTRGISENLAKSLVERGILEAMKNGLSLPLDKLPKFSKKQRLPKGIAPITDLLKVLLKLKCEQHDVAQKLVANSRDIELIAAFGEKACIPALKGWRREIFGKDALALKAGKLALLIDQNEIVLSNFPTSFHK